MAGDARLDMGGTESEKTGEGDTRPVVVTTGSMGVPARPDVPAARSSASPYVGQTLPISLSKPAVPPWVRELTRLLDRHAGGRDDCANLRRVERTLRMPGANVADLPAEVVCAAGMELRWLARRDAPSRPLARMLDQFEHEVLQPALRRLHHARTADGR
jgi:hypothetical protein